MADEVDKAAEITDAYLGAAVRRACQPVPIGAPGVCDECGIDSPRLVGDRCAPCRDQIERDVQLGRRS